MYLANEYVLSRITEILLGMAGVDKTVILIILFLI